MLESPGIPGTTTVIVIAEMSSHNHQYLEFASWHSPSVPVPANKNENH